MLARELSEGGAGCGLCSLRGRSGGGERVNRREIPLRASRHVRRSEREENASAHYVRNDRLIFVRRLGSGRARFAR